MTKTSKTLIFFGNERLSTGFVPHGAPTLQALIDNGYDVKAVVSNFTRATSRKARKLEVQEVAEAHNIPVLLPQRLRDIKEKLAAYGAEAAVLVAYGKMVPQDIIDIFPKGIINIHPSLLPQYRGSTPIESAILDGAPETGVSLMKLVKEMDAGPVWAQEKVTLRGNETKQALTETLLEKGKNMLIQHLPSILEGTLQAKLQNDLAATYTRLLTKADGVLDTKNKTAKQLEREIRAFAVWPKSRTVLYGKDIIVTKAIPHLAAGNYQLAIPCANDTFLEITELISQSGKKVSAQAFLNGLH